MGICCPSNLSSERICCDDICQELSARGSGVLKSDYISQSNIKRRRKVALHSVCTHGQKSNEEGEFFQVGPFAKEKIYMKWHVFRVPLMTVDLFASASWKF